jgi:RNA polymerase sigma-70 factor (ECF subfamily)
MSSQGSSVTWGAAVSHPGISCVHATMVAPMEPMPMSVPAEREAAASSGTASFEEFFDAEGSRLFGALVLMSGNRAEAEEIVQDAFLRVWERWERVSTMKSPAGFLYRTSMNLYRSRLRRTAVAIRKAAHLLAQDDALAEVEQRDEVARLLRSLTPREREALVLTAYLGYSTVEAGRLLGIRANTVRVLTARAWASLRRRTTQEEPR